MLVEKQRQTPELLGVVIVDGPHLLLAAVRRDDLLHVADAETLLHGQDHDEIGDVYTVVFALHRRRHDLQPDVVVDGGGGHEVLLRSRRGGNEAEILLQKHDDLIHIQPQIRNGVPLRQVVVGDELVPAPQLVGHKVLVVLHEKAPSLIDIIDYITNGCP